jgi:hypothetical protein
MLVELEWLGYIFMQLFNTARGTLRENSLLEWLCGGSSNERIGYYWLHMLGNYLENMVDKRVTTELVAGYESPIHDVREMYARKEQGVVSICLSPKDLQFVLRLFKQQIQAYQQIVRVYLEQKI